MSDNLTPPETMDYQIFRVEFGERTHNFSLEYDYLLDLTDYFIKLYDVWPESPALVLFEEFIPLIEKELQEEILPHITDPEELWIRIQRTLALLGLQINPIRWVIFTLAWVYVYANHIGDW